MSDYQAIAERAVAGSNCGQVNGPTLHGLARALLACDRERQEAERREATLREASKQFLRELADAELNASEAWFGRAFDEAVGRFRAALSSADTQAAATSGEAMSPTLEDSRSEP